jgi:mRNA interferase MazF
MKRGDVFLFDLSVGIGHEQHGERPAILLSNPVNGMALVIPLTSNLKSLRLSHTLNVLPSKKNRLDCESVALVFQLKSVDKRRMIRRIGQLDGADIVQLNEILKDLLSLK